MSETTQDKIQTPRPEVASLTRQTYPQWAPEYDALRTRALFVHLNDRTHIGVRGRHWQKFLHSITTQELRTLAPNRAYSGAQVTATGAYVFHFVMLPTGDGCLLHTETAGADLAMAGLQKFVMALDVKFSLAGAQWDCFHLAGPQASQVLGRAFGEELVGSTHAPLAMAALPHGGYVVNHTRTGEVGYDLHVPSGELQPTLDKLVGAGAEVGHLPCLEAARIEAGLPRAGWELDARSMPNEVSLQHAVDLKKGCFPGYEALAKMVNRGEPRRQLRVLVLPKGFDTPAPDTELAVEDKKIGWTASACYSPTLDTHVSLALIKTRFADLESDPGLIVGGTAAPEARLQAPPVRWGGGQALPVASY